MKEPVTPFFLPKARGNVYIDQVKPPFLNIFIGYFVAYSFPIEDLTFIFMQPL